MTASSDEVKSETAKLVAAEAARKLGIEAPLLLLRSGDNDVFQAGDVVLRVASNEADVVSQLALASWLSDRVLQSYVRSPMLLRCTTSRSPCGST